MQTSLKLRHFHSRQYGISMVEVLIALVIFAFGTLAIAGLQLAAFKYQKSAGARAGSATMLTDLAERMQANIDAARSGAYLLDGGYTDLVAEPPHDSACDAAISACTAKDIAQNDIAGWFKGIAAALPGGVGTIKGNGANGFIATVMWFDKNAVDSGGVLTKSLVCDKISAPSSTCCPATTPVGVRCVNSLILP